jgi:hypothetical protein
MGVVVLGKGTIIWTKEMNIEYKVLNNIVRDMCGGLRDIPFGNKLRALRPGLRSFWSFKKIIKDKFCGIPALKLMGSLSVMSRRKPTQKPQDSLWPMITPYNLSCPLQTDIAAPFSKTMHLMMIHLHTHHPE